MKSVNSISDLVDALGGTAATARICGVGMSAVSNWRSGGRIAPDNLFKIWDEADKMGIAIDRSIFGGVHNETAA